MIAFNERPQSAEQATRMLLGPHFDALSALHAVAFRKYTELRRDAPDLVAEIHPVTKLNVVHDFAVREAKSAFPPGVEGISEREFGREHGLVFSGVFDGAEITVVAILKGLNRSGVPSTYRTRRQRARERQLQMRGLPTVIEVVVGHYCVDGVLSEVRIVCPRNRKRNYWEIPLAVNQALLVPTPRILPGDGEADIRTRKAE